MMLWKWIYVNSYDFKHLHSLIHLFCQDYDMKTANNVRTGDVWNTFFISKLG